MGDSDSLVTSSVLSSFGVIAEEPHCCSGSYYTGLWCLDLVTAGVYFTQIPFSCENTKLLVRTLSLFLCLSNLDITFLKISILMLGRHCCLFTSILFCAWTIGVRIFYITQEVKLMPLDGNHQMLEEYFSLIRTVYSLYFL